MKKSKPHKVKILHKSGCDKIQQKFNAGFSGVLFFSYVQVIQKYTE